MEANKTILQMKYARIVSIFAEQTGITLEDALDFFYTSSIYQMMNEGIADMHCRSDGYLADLVKEEWKNKNAQIPSTHYSLCAIHRTALVVLAKLANERCIENNFLRIKFFLQKNIIVSLFSEKNV